MNHTNPSATPTSAISATLSASHQQILMASFPSAERPIKKRKLYELPPFPPPPAWEPPPALQHPAEPLISLPSAPLTAEDFVRKQRNRDEIRKVYEMYRTVKRCIEQNDPLLMPQFEQAYLGLISSSRGCSSVQRIVSNIIPRYSSYCPTALEAAAKVSINMYNFNLPTIIKGEDLDGVAYQTAKSCVFGLVDICRTAAHEAPSSSVINGICSAVFQNVLMFFTASVEGGDTWQISSGELSKLQGSIESFTCLKEELEDHVKSALCMLHKFQTLCLFRIFFSFPKNLIAASLELLFLGATDGFQNKGVQYFLNHITTSLDAAGMPHSCDPSVDGSSSAKVSNQSSTPCGKAGNMECVSNSDSSVTKSSHLTKNCWLEMVFGKDPSLKGFIKSKRKELCSAFDLSDAYGLSSFLEEKFGSILEMKEETVGENSDDCVKKTLASLKEPVQHNEDVKVTTKYGVPDTSNEAQNENKIASVDEMVQHGWKELPNDSDNVLVKRGFPSLDKESLPLKQAETREPEDKFHDTLSFAKDAVINRAVSTFIIEHSDVSNDVKRESFKVEIKNHALESDCNIVASRSTAYADSACILSPHKRNSFMQEVSSGRMLWYHDGDPDAMDVFPASKQLWLGSLGPDASETAVRLQFEDFGPLELFLFLPSKNFVLIEYRNIIDAARARKYMQGSSLWGGCVDIKFLDAGLGSKGSVNGVAIGDSRHVYIGQVLSNFAKDEILNDLMKQGLNRHVTTELTSESALILEFGTAEEATVAMVYIRKQRSCMKDIFRNSKVAVGREAELQMSLKSSRGHTSHGLDTPDYNAQPFQSNWRSTIGSKVDIFSGSYDDRENLKATGPFVGLSTSHSSENWKYNKLDVDSPYAQANQQFLPVDPRVSIANMSVQIPPARPDYYTRSGCWNTPDPNPLLSVHHHVSTGMILHDNQQVNSFPTLPPVPTSVAPLPQLHGNTLQCFDKVAQVVPAQSPAPHPPHHFRPSLPSTPPPLPLIRPSLVPPLSSPLPILQSVGNASKSQAESCSSGHQWQGILSKSGVRYCSVYALREDSTACKYLNAVSEPADWPSKLDVTKRTDMQHVKTTFSNTPSHKREVCRLFPSTTNDHRGLHDFISYLRRKECAGVIKIPAGRSMWARLLFILPHSLDTCTLLAITPYPDDCLITLILPKETHQE